MADYAIGDVQGCYQQLMNLLSTIDYDEHRDRLWFVGDLVNRGPHSLAVLRFIKQQPLTPRITLGNHDLYALHRLFNASPKTDPTDTIDDFLQAPDRDELGHWLRQQPLLHHDADLDVVMCHAGIAPFWTLDEATRYAKEASACLVHDHFQPYLDHLFGNTPDSWSDKLTGFERFRTICNYFTRMRYCDEHGKLVFDYEGAPLKAPQGVYPWFAVPNRIALQTTLVFGHWAALQGQCATAHVHALDHGCVWGGALMAMRLQDKQAFAVDGV